MPVASSRRRGDMGHHESIEHVGCIYEWERVERLYTTVKSPVLDCPDTVPVD